MLKLSGSSNDISFLPVATLILFTLRLCGVIELNFVWIALPLFIDRMLCWLKCYTLRINFIEAMILIVVTLKLWGIVYMNWGAVIGVLILGEMLYKLDESNKSSLR